MIWLNSSKTGTDLRKRRLCLQLHCAARSVGQDRRQIVALGIGGILDNEIHRVVAQGLEHCMHLHWQGDRLAILQQVDSHQLEDKIAHVDMARDPPELHQANGICHAALLHMRNVRVEIRLEAFAVGNVLVQPHIRFGVIEEPSGHDVDMEVGACAGRLPAAEPRANILAGRS